MTLDPFSFPVLSESLWIVLIRNDCSIRWLWKVYCSTVLKLWVKCCLGFHTCSKYVPLRVNLYQTSGKFIHNIRAPWNMVIGKVLWVAVLSDSSKLHCRTHINFWGYPKIWAAWGGEGTMYLIWGPSGYGLLAILIKNRVGKITDFGLTCKWGKGFGKWAARHHPIFLGVPLTFPSLGMSSPWKCQKITTRELKQWQRRHREPRKKWIYILPAKFEIV